MSERPAIIAIGRNEGERLIRCLDALPVDRGPLIYVDSGSTDSSVAAAQARGAQVVALDMSRPFTAARGRNAGIEALRAQGLTTGFVQFLDGDCELDAAWLPVATAFLADRPEVAVVCGYREESHPNASIYNRLIDAEWRLLPPGKTDQCGGDALMRLEALQAVGDFDGALVAGEEPELCSRLRAAGWTIWRLDQPMTRHDAAMLRFSQWWLRAVRGGFGCAQVWDVTRGRATAMYATEVRRALLWGAAVPAAILVGGIVWWPLLAGVLVYPLQVLRIAARDRAGTAPLTRAAFVVVGKFAECQGVLRYARRRLFGGAQTAVQYK